MVLNEELESKYLNTTTRITIVSPDTIESPEVVLILLHGSLYPEGDFSLFERLPNELMLPDLCDNRKIMIVLPFMPKNSYYISNNGFDCDRFLADELPAYVCRQFPSISHTEIVLGGISMGGYGSILVGAHTRRFKKILSISGAFIQNDIIIGNPEIWGRSTPDNIADRESFLRYFSPFTDLEKSTDRNISQALRVLSFDNEKPSFFLSCGTSDRLYKRNTALVKQLQLYGFIHDFVPLAGNNHDAACFRKGLWTGVDWLFRHDSKLI